MAKRTEIDMGNYIAADEERKAMIWCVKNNIYISPKAKSSTTWSIVIVVSGREHEDPTVYKKIEIWKKIFEYYKYYFKKYKK